MAEENTQGQGQAARKRMARRSAVYEHFTCFVDAQGSHKAKCSLVLGANTRNGTSNLRTHVRICKSRPMSLSLQLSSGPGESSMAREPAGLREEEKEAGRDLARMIALGGYDPSVLDNDYFRSFVRRLNPRFELPSRRAIEEMCDGIFDEARSDRLHLSSDEHHRPRKISLAEGEYNTIIEAGQVLFTTIHYIDDHWNLQREFYDVYVVEQVGDHYQVWRVPVVSLDDRAVLCSPGEYELFMVAGETTDQINQMKNRPKKQSKELILSTVFMDHVLHSIARCLVPDSNFPKKILDDIDPWEYDERWYSCYCSLEILGHTFPDYYSDDSTKLLRTLWREICRAIKRVSDSSRAPTSNLCLQDLFNVKDVLLSQLLEALPAAHEYRGFGNKNVVDVLTEALDTVDKAIQDSYLVWSLPLVLDPRYILRHVKIIFERAFGSEAEKYVSEIAIKTKELYTRYIEADDQDLDGITEERMAVDSTNNPLEHAAKVDSHAEAKAELDRYLEDGLIPSSESFDILDWWKQNSRKYPTVARMARDALAMPTCSNKLTSDQIARLRSILRGF